MGVAGPELVRGALVVGVGAGALDDADGAGAGFVGLAGRGTAEGCCPAALVAVGGVVGGVVYYGAVA